MCLLYGNISQLPGFTSLKKHLIADNDTVTTLGIMQQRAVFYTSVQMKITVY